MPVSVKKDVDIMKTMKKHISSSLLPSISNQFDFFGANFFHSGGLPQSQIYNIDILFSEFCLHTSCGSIGRIFSHMYTVCCRHVAICLSSRHLGGMPKHVCTEYMYEYPKYLHMAHMMYIVSVFKCLLCLCTSM